MLRFIALFTLRLAICLGFICLLISRQWGWSEYASPELYVVYYQITSHGNQYFIVSADGSSLGQKLVWKDDPIATLDCSPDGRVFAFLTENGHLYVVTRAGLLYDSVEDRPYMTVNVANDGTAALFDPADGKLLVRSRHISLSTPDRLGNSFDRIDISSQGLVLWAQDFADIEVVSLATGAVIPSVPHGYSGQWLASEQMIVFSDQVTDSEGIGLYGGQYLMDLATQKVVRIGDWTLASPLSPDGTKVAASVAINSLNHVAQVAVYDVFGRGRSYLLTHDPKTVSDPDCFLSFRPQMLVSSGS